MGEESRKPLSFARRIIHLDSLQFTSLLGDVSSSKLAKTKMAQSVLDVGWLMIKTQRSYKAKEQGVWCLEVNEAYSTQACSCCGTIPASSPEGRAGPGVSEWVCSDCGAEHERDINAACKVLNLGLGYQATANGIPALQGLEVSKIKYQKKVYSFPLIQPNAPRNCLNCAGSNRRRSSLDEFSQRP